jgi:hypothetical protein
MTLVNKATAVANLTRMGYRPTHAKYIADEWEAYQSAFSLSSLTAVGSADLPVYASGLDIDVGGKFFMSCHYGSYPHVVSAIAQRAKDRTIYVLIGSESESLKDALQRRAEENKIVIHFLDGGFGMMRRIKKALAENFPVFVEIDVPWGPSHECNMSFPFVGGQLKAKDGLFRMIERLGVQKNFVLSIVGKQSIAIVNYGDLGQAECFALFADAVRSSPHQYERLFQMHQYFQPDVQSDVAIVWEGQKGKYLIHASDMKAWATQASLPTGEKSREAIAQIIGRRVDDVVSL